MLLSFCASMKFAVATQTAHPLASASARELDQVRSKNVNYRPATRAQRLISITRTPSSVSLVFFENRANLSLVLFHAGIRKAMAAAHQRQERQWAAAAAAATAVAVPLVASACWWRFRSCQQQQQHVADNQPRQQEAATPSQHADAISPQMAVRQLSP